MRGCCHPRSQRLSRGSLDDRRASFAPSRAWRIAWANDASVYRLVPRAVVLPRDVDEVRGLLALSRRQRIPLVFRAAGTSLSGQAVTDGILAVVARHWRGVEVRDGGKRVWVQPGIIGGVVKYQRPGTE